MTTSNEHNNAPAVAQGLERYEPTVMVEESRGRLTATGAVMKPKEDGRWVRLRDLTATPAPAPAQEVGLTDEEIEAIAKKHMSTVGDHWCNEEAIREIHAEDFARAIIAALLAKWGQVMDDAQAPAPAQEIDKSVADAEIKAMYVESQGSDKGWLGIEGSYFTGGVVAARKQKAAPEPAQERCHLCDCTGDIVDQIGEWRGECPYCKPAQEVGLTDETQAQDERRSTHLAASGGAHVG